MTGIDLYGAHGGQKDGLLWRVYGLILHVAYIGIATISGKDAVQGATDGVDETLRVRVRLALNTTVVTHRVWNKAD